MALSDKVRSAVRRVRRDGPLDVVFVLFNADGMGGTARSGIAQANALVGLGEGPDDLAPFEPGAFVDALLT